MNAPAKPAPFSPAKSTVTTPKQKEYNTPVSRLHDVSDSHPACQAGNSHIHEKAYVTNSAGGDITEGCVEHYYDRIVVNDEPVVDVARVPERLAEYVVMSEVLFNPRFKRKKF